MYQQSFADVEHSKRTKQSERELFLNEMESEVELSMDFTRTNAPLATQK